MKRNIRNKTASQGCVRHYIFIFCPQTRKAIINNIISNVRIANSIFSCFTLIFGQINDKIFTKIKKAPYNKL